MYCNDLNECYNQISAYFNGEKTGYFLLVNTETYNSNQAILQRLEADTGKIHVFVSDHCSQNGLPDIDSALAESIKVGNFALVGVSQALKLRNAEVLESKIDEILSKSISGHCVILLEHCQKALEKFMNYDIRLNNRVVILNEESTYVPRIKITQYKAKGLYDHYFKDFQKMLKYLERITDEMVVENPSILLQCELSASLFKNAVYSVTEADGIYESLSKKYSDIASATEKKFGTDNQWNWLATEMLGCNSFSELVTNYFGTISNLAYQISDILDEHDENKKWLLWLAMKVFCKESSKYLCNVLKNSNNVNDFTEHAYLDLIKMDSSSPEFLEHYNGRKKLLEQLPEQFPLFVEYCNKLGSKDEKIIYYLTDKSSKERYLFFDCLSRYSYTWNEIKRIVSCFSKDLELYLKDYSFNNGNTKLSDADASLRKELTEYFKDYKKQKLINKLDGEFVEKVNNYALTRPYNKLQSRSSIVSHTDKKNTQLFFFDALGVEYLSYINAKCEEYGLISEVSIGRCELPSITEKNKEFIQYFKDGNWCKIDKLDEIKHHSQIYDYQKCKLPIHLIEELDVIDQELRQIHSMLVQGSIEKALIVSDHGASRLAVLYQHESDSKIVLDESGKHSGRCCPVSENPNLPYAAYEDGYSVLANYERFRGGRRANVEVHGGASFEEVLVPIIAIIKKPDNVEICFTDSTIILKARELPELTLYSSVPLNNPRLCILGEFYDGEFGADNKHYKFVVPKIKRKGTYSAVVYDGEKNLSVTLEFKAQKQTREVDLF